MGKTKMQSYSHYQNFETLCFGFRFIQYASLVRLNMKLGVKCTVTALVSKDLESDLIVLIKL